MAVEENICVRRQEVRRVGLRSTTPRATIPATRRESYLMKSSDRASTLRQKQLYEDMHAAYTAHYYDEPSLRFRREFLIAPLVAGLDFNGRQVADLACGAGFNSQLLREVFPDVHTT